MSEMKKVESYLANILSKKPVEVRAGQASGAWELYLGGEFFGTIYEDTDDGELNYDLNVSILGIDLK
ncbi:MAG: DUF3126 family protein [Alphaproteobacteria bacterium]|nr:DUF3126 family protein [Alphaproteobacteria bacterium]MBN2779967.1 DUF3126 family protein [Alphaproteobacteria bacterium]